MRVKSVRPPVSGEMAAGARSGHGRAAKHWDAVALDKLLAEMKKRVSGGAYSEDDADLVGYWTYRLQACKRSGGGRHINTVVR